MLAANREESESNLVGALKPSPIVLASVVALRCCILAIAVGSTIDVSAAEDAETRPEPTNPEQQEPSLFRLPGFLKRDRETRPVAKPVEPNRFVTRATQLLAQAKTLEANGEPEAALEIARRAESIIKAAGHTTGTQWPSRTQSPAQYITGLKQRTGVMDVPPSSNADTPMFVSEKPQPLAQSQPANTAKREPAAGPLLEELAAPSQPLSQPPSKTKTEGPKRANAPALPVTPHRVISGKPLLNWGDRYPTLKIQLIGATQESPGSATTDGTTDETKLLIQQLGELETWTTIEPPAGEGSDIRNLETGRLVDAGQGTKPPPPLIIPGLIDRPDGIDDQNVAPIPTRPTDSIEGSPQRSVTTTIPVVPDADGQSPPASLPQHRSVNRDNQPAIAAENSASQNSVYETTPQLLTQTGDATATLSATVGTNDSPASVWQIAAAQLVATFLGVVLAVGIFLLTRAAAMRLFGTRLGVTFHFGSTMSATAASRANDESSHVVPFGSPNSLDASTIASQSPQETDRTSGVTDLAQNKTEGEEQPASVPLRRAA